MNVYVEPAYNFGFSFVNFDAVGQATYSRSDGVYSTVANPSPSGVNTSALSGKYVRNSTVQYDYIQYNTTAITNAADYKTKAKKFYMDVYTSASIGKPIIIQLENGSTATSTNYPTGRNSRYIGYTTKLNQWERIIFTLLDVPDAATSDASVNRLLVLINSNSFTGDTYYIDNLDSYTAGTPAIRNPTVTEKIFKPEVNKSDLKSQLYPNPATNELRITNLRNNAKVDILNNVGQMVAHYKFEDGGSALINISNLMPGNYFVRLTEDGKIENLKLIKY